MGRIDRNGSNDRTLEKEHIKDMLRIFAEYEEVKTGNHKQYNYVQELFDAKGVCKQNFHKYYRRYLLNNRDENHLLPRKRGSRFKLAEELYSQEIILRIKEFREKGYNRYYIASKLKSESRLEIHPSTIYRLTRKMGISKINRRIKEEVVKIVKTKVGELGHIDIHYLPKDIIKGKESRLYLLGIIDDYSRVCWLDIVKSTKSLDVMFASMEILGILRSRYEIEFKEMLSDNGSEFASKNNRENHPFEKLLDFMGIKHRYTKPYRPQTNGKIERFWRTIKEELLEDEQFDSIDELKEFVIGYSIYYNEERMHQGINCKVPVNMINH